VTKCTAVGASSAFTSHTAVLGSDWCAACCWPINHYVYFANTCHWYWCNTAACAV